MRTLDRSEFALVAGGVEGTITGGAVCTKTTTTTTHPDGTKTTTTTITCAVNTTVKVD